MDKIFICQRCQERNLKASPPCESKFKWSLDSFKELKLEFMRETGRKTSKKIVLTTCLGSCPEKAVAYQESRERVLQEPSHYDSKLSKEEVKKLLFK